MEAEKILWSLSGIRELSYADELGLQVESSVSTQTVQPRVGNKYSFSSVGLYHTSTPPQDVYMPLLFLILLGLSAHLPVLLQVWVFFSAPLAVVATNQVGSERI